MAWPGSVGDATTVDECPLGGEFCSAEIDGSQCPKLVDRRFVGSFKVDLCPTWVDLCTTQADHCLSLGDSCNSLVDDCHIQADYCPTRVD